MAIPFPPGGPQVQAALQNPARFPDQRLQEYAQGQQPTGQVPPPMAANELTIRNAQRQAASRQSAMQNNPQNSPTVFQQKDMELQQKAQQLAAMQQQMQQQMQQREQQTQQKEQQLGVIGALMAKKAQDLQAREAMGVAQLPVNPDMFTAMHGGIVFNGGGGVKGYSGKDNESQVRGLYSRGILDTLADVFSQLYGTSFEEGMARTKEGQRDKALREELSRVPSTVGEPEPTIYAKEQEKPKDKKRSGESTGQRAPTTPQSNIFKEYMNMVAPYAVTPESVQQYRQGILGSLGRMREGYDKSQLTPEQRAVIEKEERDRLAQEYAEYTKGRDKRMEKIRSSLEGEAPSVWSKLAAGLPTDTRGMRLGTGIASIAKGYVGKEDEYEKRKREAAKYMAEADELAARADLAEKRGQTAAGRQLSAAEDLRRKQAYELLGVSESAYRQGVGALMSDEQAEQQKQLSMAMGAAGADVSARQQERLKLLELQNQRPSALQERLALFKSDPATYEKLFGDKTSGRRPGPRDIIAVQQYVAGLPLEQLPLSDEVRLAIKNDAKSLKDPTSRLNQEIQEARNKVAQKILSSGITDADDISSGR